MLIKGINLSIGYNLKVVSTNINFEIDEGDVVCIVGENGAGKSTLLKTILGILKPIKGEFEYSPSLNVKRFGYLPQTSESQNDFPATVKEIVLSGRINGHKNKLFFNKEDRKIAYDNMKLLDIFDLADRAFSTLSGGQRQRVLIARALCATDEILFLDEPLTGLDPKIIKEFYQIVQQLHEEGITIVMISHDLDEAVNLATKILFIGEENYFMSKDEFVNSPLGKKFLSFGGRQ